jgi:hypothetical protein
MTDPDEQRILDLSALLWPEFLAPAAELARNFKLLYQSCPESEESVRSGKH